MRGLVQRALTKLGHDVRVAADGTAALAALEGTHVDLVVSDVYMAEMDGMELLVRIQQRGISVPVLVISGGGYRRKEDVLAMAASCGAVATLDKPFTPEELRKAIEPLLASDDETSSRGPNAT